MDSEGANLDKNARFQQLFTLQNIKDLREKATINLRHDRRFERFNKFRDYTLNESGYFDFTFRASEDLAELERLGIDNEEENNSSLTDRPRGPTEQIIRYMIS